MEVKVYNANGNATKRKATLDPAVFEIEPNDHVVWLDVRRIQAHARQGTHKAKERSEVRGSTRKLYRQKGTGYARAGDAKSPIRRSGGTIFGPRPRQYRLKLNKKETRLARRSALTYKARGEACLVIDELGIDKVRTKELLALITALGLADKKVLFLTNGHQPHVYNSSRNLPNVSVKNAMGASTLDIMKADVIVLEEAALESISQQLGESASAEA